MSKFQLWSRDEYGQGSILMTSESIDEVVKRGKMEVTNINVNNALTSEDRERNWEAYFILISSDSKRNKKKYVLDSSDPRITNAVYAISDNSINSINLEDVPKAVINVYLGNISADRKVEKDWFAVDIKRNKIDKIDHSELSDKIAFFIKKVKS